MITASCLLFLASNARGQTKLGQDIDAEAAGDNCGWSVSLSSDGSRVAIGAPNNGGTGLEAGHVRVYEWSGSAWVQLGSDIDGVAAGEHSGWSVSLASDGSRVAIGAYKNSISRGQVRVYEWSGSAWVQLGQDIKGEFIGDESGTLSLSADGTRVAIGAHFNDGNGGNSGHVRVYEWSGSAWVQVGQDIDGEAADDFSGEFVSLSADGSRVAISAYLNDGAGTQAGQVRVYGFSGGAWVQIGQDIDGEAALDFFGSSVALSTDGNRVAAGALGNDGNGSNSGHVRVFELSGGTWVQLGQDIDGEAEGDNAGSAVSLTSDGSRVAVGARLNDGGGANAGSVRIYDWSGTAWVQYRNDIDGEGTGDQSGGNSVSLSTDGGRVAIGAIANANAGHVRVYELPNTPVGTDVAVTRGNAELTFDHVTTEGFTGVTIRNTGPQAPAGFTLTPSDPAAYYNIATSAVFSDSIDVCLTYDPADVVGSESALTLQHYNQTSMAWDDITRSVDEVNNRVCGRTASLSPFVMATRNVLGTGRALPTAFRLYTALPNPALRQTRILYELSVAATVDLRIYDAAGALVRVLEAGSFKAANRHDVVWNGRDDNGVPVVPGVYFYRLTAGGNTAQRKLVVLR